MHRFTWIGIVTPVLCTGLAALFCEHLQYSPPLTEAIHVLFAVVTCTAIAAVLVTGALDLAEQPILELQRFTRLVSRWVYILVYLLAVVRIGFYLLDSSQARGSHPLHPVVRSTEDFQTYVWSCLIPLWLIRGVVLSDRFRVISQHRAAQRHLNASGDGKAAALDLTNVNRAP